MIDIVICSSSDISPKEAELRNLIFAPLQVNINEKWYRDGIDISSEEFNKHLSSLENIPTTSQVSPAIFEEAFEKIENEALIITMSSELSGTYQSAMIAAMDYPNIHVLDTETASIGEQILIDKACELRDNGASLEEIENTLNLEKKNIVIIGILDNLKFLKHGGRISSTKALAGELLKIKPVLTLINNHIGTLGKARGQKKAAKLVMNYIEENGGIDDSHPIYMAYSGNDESLIDKYLLSTNISKEKVLTTQTGSVIGTHVGPDTVLLSYMKKS